jgi:hypothetical protein
MEEVSQEWSDEQKQRAVMSNYYLATFDDVLDGSNYSMMQGYPDYSANSILQFMFDSVDHQKIESDWFLEQYQMIMDKWLLDIDGPENVLEELKAFWLELRC